MNSLPFVFNPIKNTLIVDQGVITRKPRTIRVKQSESVLQLGFSRKDLDKPLNIVVFNQPNDLSLTLHWFEQIEQNVTLFWYLPENNRQHQLTMTLDAYAQGRLTVVLIGQSSSQTLAIQADIHNHAQLDFGLAIVGGQMTNLTHQINLLGEHASCRKLGLAVQNQTAILKMKEAVHHLSPLSESLLQNYMIANHQAFIHFEVIGKIHKGNHGSNCRQNNRGVILEPLGAIQVDPLLLIDEYDVQAGHGAAVGEINPEELYYLQSRGLKEIEAKRLIISGYIKPFLERFDYHPFASYLEVKIDDIIKGSD